jgi:predicted GNAT family N-acyltransferase
MFGRIRNELAAQQLFDLAAQRCRVTVHIQRCDRFVAG